MQPTTAQSIFCRAQTLKLRVAILGVMAALFARPAAADFPPSSGVNVVADGLPSFADPAVIWYTAASSCLLGHHPNIASIQRTSTYGAAPRQLFGFLQGPPGSTCSRYVLASNLADDGAFLYFVDNQGPNGDWELERRSRNANLADPSTPLVDLGTSLSNLTAEVNAQYPTVLFVIAHRPDLGAIDAIVEYDKTNGAVLNAGIETGSENQLGNMQFDGRYLYWTNGLLLRADDTTNGVRKTVASGGIQSYHPVGYFNECDPVCNASAGVVYGQGNQILQTDTIGGGLLTLYTSPNAGARIGPITQDSLHYFFFERRTTGPGIAAPGEDRLNRISSLSFNQTTADTIYGPIPIPTGPTGSGLGFDSLTTDLAYLYFHDRVAGALVRVANDAAAIPDRKLRATGLEITQGIQDAGNDVSLIEARRTFVRFYVKSDDGTDVPNVTAGLDVTNYNGTYLGHLEPVNSIGKLLTVKANPTRFALNDSFLFELPIGWTLGTANLALTATVNPLRIIPEVTYTDDALTVYSPTIQASPRLPLEIVDFDYAYNGTLVLGGVFDDYDSADYMTRTYPLQLVGGGISSPGPGLHLGKTTVLDNAMATHVDQSDKDCAKLNPAGGPDNRNMCAGYYALGKVSSMRSAGDLPKDRYYWASIPNNYCTGAPPVCLPLTRGFTPSGGTISVGPMTDFSSNQQEYMSHEIGHALGRGHPANGGSSSCGEVSPLDTAYPYVNSWLANTGFESDYAGFDPGSSFSNNDTIWRGDSSFDFMSYCRPSSAPFGGGLSGTVWVSAYTYRGLYDYMSTHTLAAAALPRAAGQPGAAAAAIPGDWLLAFGNFSTQTGSGIFSSVRRLDAVADVPIQSPGDYALELRDGGAALLASYPFTPASAEEGNPAGRTFGLVVPFADGTRSLRVVESATSKLIVSQAVSASRPTVSDVTLVGAPNPVSGKVTVSWTGNDADGDPLGFDLFYSHDGGGSWKPVQLSLTNESILLDTSALGGGTGVLRVEVNDGTQSARADSAPFVVALKAPVVRIQEPAVEKRIQWGQLVNFAGYADDPQEQPIPDGNFVWTSKYRTLGTGRTLAVSDLEVGDYDVTLSVTNAAALAASATVHVVVGDDLRFPGPLLSALPASISFAVPQAGAGLQTASLGVENVGGGTTFPITAQSSASWVAINGVAEMPVSITAPGLLTVTADPSGLPAAQASLAQIVLTNTNNPSDSVTVPVTLVKGDAFLGVVIGDTDGDGVLDDVDNCVLVPNPSQLDADQDGYGNACDPDLNNDGIVNFADLALMKKVFFKTDAAADLNGDGVVNFADLAIMKKSFFKTPGPSGLDCAGKIPCSAP